VSKRCIYREDFKSEKLNTNDAPIQVASLQSFEAINVQFLIVTCLISLKVLFRISPRPASQAFQEASR